MEKAIHWEKVAKHIIKEFEACELVAYEAKQDVWKIGYGYSGKDVSKGTAWTKVRAEMELENYVESDGDYIEAAVSVPLTEYEKGALVSFVRSLGRVAFAKSNLLKLLNKGNTAEAAEQFEKHTKENGQVVKRLTRRRGYERFVFLGGSIEDKA